MQAAHVSERDGILIGEVRRPVNESSLGIHDEALAKKMGFRGATIAGSTHLEQFPPLLLRAFGTGWFQTGSLSMYFRYATRSEEPVQCFVRVPPAERSDAQVEAWMEIPEGQRVCEGTASIGQPAEPSALRGRIGNLPPSGDVRILASFEPGMKMGSQLWRIEPDRLARYTKGMTEPLDAYRHASGFGGLVVPPGPSAGAARAAEDFEGMHAARAVCSALLFGALEIRHVNGPILAGRDYVCSGQVLAVGDTPKSEFYWYESELRELDRQEIAASVIVMLRFMKAASPLWQS